MFHDVFNKTKYFFVCRITKTVEKKRASAGVISDAEGNSRVYERFHAVLAI